MHLAGADVMVTFSSARTRSEALADIHQPQPIGGSVHRGSSPTFDRQGIPSAGKPRSSRVSLRERHQDLAQFVALDRVGLDVVRGDQRLGRRHDAGQLLLADSRSAVSIATSPVRTGKESTVPVSSPARIEA